MRGKMWVFGGHNGRRQLYYNRQLLTVGDCSLKKEGQLPFDFLLGACDTFNQPGKGEVTLLCFDRMKTWPKNLNYKDCNT